MDRVINRGSHFLLRTSTLLDSQSIIDHFINWVSSFFQGFQTTMDSVIYWVSSFFQSLQTTMDCIINWLVSLISCLGTKINPILEKFTGHTFNVKDNSCDEVGIDGEMLLHVAGAVGAAVVAIVLVWFVWKMIMTIFICCCRRGRTMKAPGRNYRILRDNFERNPADYFRNLRIDQRNVCLV